MNEHIFCPTCKKTNTWHASNTYKPFCSIRCKLIDLGNWADESYRVEGDELKPSNDEEIN